MQKRTNVKLSTIKINFMKKLLLSVTICVLAVFGLYAQNEQFVSTTPSNRNVVIEEYTGINCGYCPDGHRIANQLVANNPGRIFAINIHAGGYAANTYTTQHGNTLQSTFSVSSFPTGTVNRHTFTGYSNGNFLMSRGDWSSAANTLMAQVSPVNIAARGTLDWSTRELNITVQLYYTADEDNATNKLNVAILQDNVIGSQSGASLNPAQQVGSQYRHMHMFRGFVYNNAWGEDITTTTQGSFVEKTYTYTIPESLGTPNAIAAKLEDLHFIAFVAQGQREILTGCEVEIENINMPALSARVDGITNMEIQDCSTDAQVSTTITNIGSDPITSLTLQYSVANGTPMTYNWTGNIASMSNEEIELPTFTVNTNTNQIVKVKVINANGQDFESNEASLTIKKVVAEGTSTMTLKIKTDQYASETSYKLYGPNNQVIQQSSSFTNSTVNEFPINLTQTGCYRLQVKDSYGDGISGGYIRVFDANNNQILNISGTSFASEVNAMINVGTVDINDMTMENTLIFPNPTTDNININSESDIQMVEIYNLQGQRIAVENGNVRTLNVSNLSKGMYLLKVTTEKGVSTYKISKQ